MILVAWFIFLFTVLQFLIAFINMITRPKLNRVFDPWEGLVSILIPVRNEEDNVKNIMNDLVHQEYKNIEILVYDDESDDNSVEVIKNFSERDPRIRLIRSTGLLKGWLGKMYACHTLSQQAKGEYLLFLDADVRIQHDAVSKAVSYMRHYELGLLSVFPRQIMQTTGEWITVPVMNYILLSLLPLILVRISNFSSLAAANGQFMLFNASIYNSILPHEKTKMNLVEDIAISRMYKKKGIRIACLVGDNTIQCRMYENFHAALHGFSKNITAFFGNSFLLALIFWFITTVGFVVLLWVLPIDIFLLYIMLYISTRVIISVISQQNVLLNSIFTIPQQIIIGLLIYRAFINFRLQYYQWKGRSL